MDKFIVISFDHEEADKQIDVEVALKQENFDLIAQVDPNMSYANFIIFLSDNDVRNNIYTRPARRPRT